MRVYLDSSALGSRNLTGIGVYSKRLIPRLHEVPGIQPRPVLPWLRMNKLRRVESHLQAPVKIFTPANTWFSRSTDVYHGLDFKIPSGGRFKKVVTVHDLVEFEERFNSPAFVAQAKKKMTYLFEKCQPDYIICISEFTRQNLARYFPGFEKYSRVVYLGSDHIDPRDVGAPCPIPDPFLLYAGTLEARKNVARIVEAFEKVSPDFPTLQLVLAGGGGFRQKEILEKIENSPVRSHIRVLGYVDDATLQSLRRQAQVFVFPSLYEGFGLPVLEAMRMGCPVITSTTGALAEISGGAARQVDPENVEALADEMRHFLTDAGLRESYGKAGIEHAAGFTWSRCAAETAAVYKQVSAKVS